jgi:hypothetical protein
MPAGSSERERVRQEIHDLRVLFEELRQIEANRDNNAN